jgi:hypothetical protein
MAIKQRIEYLEISIPTKNILDTGQTLSEHIYMYSRANYSS